MTKLAIRHGLSEANNRNNVGMLAFASADAPLMDLGKAQARQLGATLHKNYGIGVEYTDVATSQMARTQETAREAGFQHISTYAVLNEVSHGLELSELREMLSHNRLPVSALKAAEAILEDPPPEDIWVTHGLVIASLCQVLGVAQEARFIPKFCEIRELPSA